MRFSHFLTYFTLFFTAMALSAETDMDTPQPQRTLMEIKQPTKLIVNWEDYYQHIMTIAKQINLSHWEFDQIVCIARGGMFAGDALSRMLSKELAIISACSYQGTEQGSLTISERIAMTTPTLGNRILVVDDLVDSGETLKEVIQAIKNSYPQVTEIKTAVLWRKTSTAFEPDYFADEVDESIWIVQPFEID